MDDTELAFQQYVNLKGKLTRPIALVLREHGFLVGKPYPPELPAQLADMVAKVVVYGG